MYSVPKVRPSLEAIHGLDDSHNNMNAVFVCVDTVESLLVSVPIVGCMHNA